MKASLKTLFVAAAVAFAATSSSQAGKEDANAAASQTEAGVENAGDAANAGANMAGTAPDSATGQVSQRMENAAERASATTSSSTGTAQPDPEVGTKAAEAPKNK